jgi:hypothetical protein
MATAAAPPTMTSTSTYTEQWLMKADDGAIVYQTVERRGNNHQVTTTTETVYPAGTEAPIPDGVQVLPYGPPPVSPVTTTTTTTTHITPPQQEPKQQEPPKQEPQQEPYPEQPPPQRRGTLANFVDSSAMTKLLIAFACLGVFFLLGNIIWWMIIYPIMLMNGWIDKVFGWGDDNKRRDDDDADADDDADSASAAMRHAPASWLLLLSTLHYLFCWVLWHM